MFIYGEKIGRNVVNLTFSDCIVLKGALLYHRDAKERKLLMFPQAKVKNYLVLHVLWEDKVLSYLNINRQNFP